MKARAAFLLTCLAFFSQNLVVHAETKISVTAQKISSLDLKELTRTHFGAFKFIGGLVLKSDHPEFGGLSALHVENQTKFLSISDTGLWVTGDLRRDENKKPTGLENAILAPLLNELGQPFQDKWMADSEGLAVSENEVLITFEQASRIASFPKNAAQFKQRSKLIEGTEFSRSLRYNFGLEAIAYAPKGANLPFDIVTISEFSPNENGNARAFLRRSDGWHEFEVPLIDNYLITDAAFLPSGDLLVLERRFSLATGARARVRKILKSEISANKIASGKVILDLNQDQIIDNMEGISIFQMPDKSLRMALISDNNLFPLQRTLYLEFEMIEQP